VAGHTGMVGQSILRLLKQEGYKNIISELSKNLDLRSQKRTTDFLEATKPEYVIVAAATVGGKFLYLP